LRTVQMKRASKDVHNEKPRTKRHLDGCAAMEPEFVAR